MNMNALKITFFRGHKPEINVRIQVIEKLSFKQTKVISNMQQSNPLVYLKASRRKRPFNVFAVLSEKGNKSSVLELMKNNSLTNKRQNGLNI